MRSLEVVATIHLKFKPLIRAIRHGTIKSLTKRSFKVLKREMKFPSEN